MDKFVTQNKTAWEFNAYDFWVTQAGLPEERAKKDLEDPRACLKNYSRYFDEVDGLKIANICGSCGKKAVPLAILGASVTVFDISEENKRYAMETAEAAGTELDFVVGDVMDIDMSLYEGYFDIVFMEGGILHYFYDISKFMELMNKLLKKDGTMICSDFHPFKKCFDILKSGEPTGDYFSKEIIEAEMPHAKFYKEEIRNQFPKCKIRRYTLSEIINAVIRSNFILRKFDEIPSWYNKELPGEFIIVAEKQIL